MLKQKIFNNITDIFDSMGLIHLYLFVGGVFITNMLKEVYYRTIEVCDMHPDFDFQYTYGEEMLLHTTRFPYTDDFPMSTIILVLLYLIVLFIWYFRIIQTLWYLTYTMLTWIYRLLFGTEQKRMTHTKKQ